MFSFHFCFFRRDIEERQKMFLFVTAKIFYWSPIFSWKEVGGFLGWQDGRALVSMEATDKAAETMSFFILVHLYFIFMFFLFCFISFFPAPSEQNRPSGNRRLSVGRSVGIRALNGSLTSVPTFQHHPVNFTVSPHVRKKTHPHSFFLLHTARNRREQYEHEAARDAPWLGSSSQYRPLFLGAPALTVTGGIPCNINLAVVRSSPLPGASAAHDALLLSREFLSVPEWLPPAETSSGWIRASPDGCIC